MIFPGIYDHYKESHMIFLNYISYSKGENIILNDELQEFKWFSQEEALKED